MSNEFRASVELVETGTRTVAVVHLTGALAAEATDEFNRVLSAVAGRGAQCLVLDCQEVEYVSSSGLRALLKLRKAALDAGGWVRLAAVRRAIREEVLDALGVSRLFDMYGSVAEAVGGVRPQADRPRVTDGAGPGSAAAAAEPSASGGCGARSGSAVTGTILVVDDDPMILRMLERILEAAGYTVVTAGDGEAGRTLARDKRPSLILLDINLPGLDGGEVAQELADELRTADIPVIFVSGLIGGRDEAELGPGGYPLVAKPFERPKLLDMVRRHIRASQTRA